MVKLVKYKVYYKSGRTQTIKSRYGVNEMQEMYIDNPKVKKIVGILPSGKEKALPWKQKRKI